MKIVVRGTNWIGDAVMQIPALRELRRVFSDSRITLATRSWAQGIFEDADFIDEIMPFEKDDSVFKQAKLWRERKFDAAILFTNSFESALVAKLGKVKTRIGYATEARSILLTDAVSVPDWKNTRHEINYYLNLVAEFEKKLYGETKVFENAPKVELNVSEGRKSHAREILRASGVDLSKPVVALCPGSTNSRAKRWHADSYAKLNDKLQRELNCNVILIGSQDELEVSEMVAKSAQIKPIVLTGKTTLSEASAILSICEVLVSNDTGPAHIGAAVGAKTLVIFGPTNPLTTHPINAEIIRKNVKCSPCMLRDCPIDHRCMTQILPSEVFGKVIDLLKKKNL